MAHNPLEGPRPEMNISLHDGSEEQVSIIIVHHNNPEYLNICIQSLHIMSNMNNYEVIIVDNNSDQETQDYLDELEADGIKVVRNKENLWWSGACNAGVAAADPNSKYYVFLHQDVVVLNTGWLDLLINVSVSQGSGLVGIEMGSYSVEDNRVDFIQEWCCLMTKECWADCGPWPEELPIVGHCFIISMRAQVKGYKPQCMKNPVLHHYKAFSMDPTDYERMSEDAMVVIPKLMREAQGGLYAV
jgi:glycosyltransferase involved in cell wall biosynthesis